MYRRRAWTVLLAAVLIAFAVPAAAQVTPAKAVGPLVWTPSASSQAPTAKGGTSFLVDYQIKGHEGDSAPFGLGLGLIYGWNEAMAIQALVHFNKFEEATEVSVLGGIEYHVKTQSKAKPFVQVLIGLEHWPGYNALAFEPGGGIEYPICETASFRATFGLRVAKFEGFSETGYRLAFGVTMPFGAK